VSSYDSIDYFSDESVIADPYPYFDYLRNRCPVLPGVPAGVVSVTGHREALAAYKDPAFSSCNSVA
jgi:cytochrome P450